MKLFIDGDAFPNLLKPIINRIIKRLDLNVIVISNKRVFIGDLTNITYILVGAGSDEADDRIIEMINERDIVITGDIPLADRLINKKAYAVDHRGKFFTEENIKQSLAVRDLMQNIRESGEVTKGPRAIVAMQDQDKENFKFNIMK